MKTAVTAFVLATLVATPAFAAKKYHSMSQQAAAAQASEPYYQNSYALDQNYYGVDGSWVIVNGRIVGRDPDPNVRLMLRRDPYADAW